MHCTEANVFGQKSKKIFGLLHTNGLNGRNWSWVVSDTTVDGRVVKFIIYYIDKYKTDIMLVLKIFLFVTKFSVKNTNINQVEFQKHDSKVTILILKKNYGILFF